MSRPATTRDEALRAYAAAAAVREEYARPWHTLSAEEMGECIVTGLRSIGWKSPDEVRAMLAAEKETAR